MISIVLIHYQAEALILKAIQSVLAYSGLPSSKLEFIIIDNSQNLNEVPLKQLNIRYKLHDPGYNSGFARAVNCGMKNSSGDYIVLMNQDACLTEENTLKKLVDLHQTLPTKSILGCSLKDERNNFQESVWIDSPGLQREWRVGSINQKLKPNWKIKFEEQKRIAHKQSGFVHRINGAFLLIPIKNLKKVNEILFDEDFFLYGEDVEWALRIKKKGWKFYHYAPLNVMHVGSASSNNEDLKQKQILASSWLTIRKRKGILYFLVFVSFSFLNKALDCYLNKRSKSKIKEVSQNYNNIIYLFKKKFIQIIFLKRSHDDFISNCYSNT